MNEVKEIPIDLIDSGKYDVRLEENDDSLEDLAASIRRVGIIVPLVVAEVCGRLEVVAGHRRLSAAKSIGLETVPCYCVAGSKAKSSEISFAENLFRKDLTPIELAAALKDAIEQRQETIEELARVLNRSSEYVRRHIAVLNWPEDVQMAVHQGWLSISAAENLACVNNNEYRDFLLGHAKTNGATARLTSAWLQAYQAMQPVSTAIKTEPSPNDQRPQPLVPQAPCIVCSDIYRTDELCHVPVCPHCIRKLRQIGGSVRS